MQVYLFRLAVILATLRVPVGRPRGRGALARSTYHRNRFSRGHLLRLWRGIGKTPHARP